MFKTQDKEKKKLTELFGIRGKKQRTLGIFELFILIAIIFFSVSPQNYSLVAGLCITFGFIQVSKITHLITKDKEPNQEQINNKKGDKS